MIRKRKEYHSEIVALKYKDRMHLTCEARPEGINAIKSTINRKPNSKTI